MPSAILGGPPVPTGARRRAVAARRRATARESCQGPQVPSRPREDLRTGPIENSQRTPVEANGKAARSGLCRALHEGAAGRRELARGPRSARKPRRRSPSTQMDRPSPQPAPRAPSERERRRPAFYDDAADPEDPALPAVSPDTTPPAPTDAWSAPASGTEQLARRQAILGLAFDRLDQKSLGAIGGRCSGKVSPPRPKFPRSARRRSFRADSRGVGRRVSRPRSTTRGRRARTRALVRRLAGRRQPLPRGGRRGQPRHLPGAEPGADTSTRRRRRDAASRCRRDAAAMLATPPPRRRRDAAAQRVIPAQERTCKVPLRPGDVRLGKRPPSLRHGHSAKMTWRVRRAERRRVAARPRPRMESRRVAAAATSTFRENARPRTADRARAF